MRFHDSKNFDFKIPASMSRLAVVGILAGLLTAAVICSRDGNATAKVALHGSRQAFIQPKNRELAEAELFPTEKVVAESTNEQLHVANVVPLPQPRPVTPGFYYELVRAQGDGDEGEYVLIERQCIPKSDMPEPCYLPERGREKFPLRSE